MKILYVGAEATPFASTGGLGDVMGSLPRSVAVADESADVRVVMPLYTNVPEVYREKMTKVAEFYVQLSWRNQYCGIYELVEDKVTYYFIDNEYYFKRAKLYGEYDDGERYAFFSKAVIELFAQVHFIPDVLHANDWQSALSIVYLKLCYYYPDVKTVYTIHNIEYQGIYSQDVLGDLFGIGKEHLSVLEYDGCINLSKAAIMCCDKLTTVSSRYAEEIKTPYYSHGLSYVINSVGGKLSGIVNGIDYVGYDPENDPVIAAPFSASKPSGKKKCKEALVKELGLDEDGTPIVAMITRLAAHKGIDLVTRVIDEAVDMGIRFVILGTGESEFESFFRQLEWRHPGKVRALIEFNKNTAKKIYAGADIFLMPSKSEPCGLAQMIASRYGTVPIVRETGGLADTIIPYNAEENRGNGVTFYSYNAHDMLDAIRRATELYNDKNVWKKIVKNAMTSDFSWNASAEKYLAMYKEIRN
ncbi:MAG: glycogen synthase GlgA [Clostridia bacterium]|nr:glycogen synthase GlgA [Clostridia bacterium]